MKKLSVIVLLAFLSGCGTPKFLMKNCKDIGSGFFECEQAQKGEFNHVK
jgi:hypothetical protein